MKLPPAEACELGPKLQCLEEVLGSKRFQAYCCDLFAQVASLRQRLGLYDACMRDFERQLLREQFVSRENLQTLFDDRLRVMYRTETIDRQLSADATPDKQPTVDLAEYFLLLQHCSDPQKVDAVVLVDDLITLLRSLPLERASLVRHVFEQLADTRRGEGYRPPPDHTKLHRIHATIKLQRSHCSVEEARAAEAWLQVLTAEDVFLQDFLQFHLAASDVNNDEDAEFVRFVQRMWGFDAQALRDGDRKETIVQLLEGFSARLSLLELIARKKELLAKMPGSHSRIQSSTSLLEVDLQHLRVLVAPPGFSRWMQCDSSVINRLGTTLPLLQELSLSGQVLTTIPDFILSLKELQVLDLRDNRISIVPAALGSMKTLQRLDLSDNLFRDASFAKADDVWSKLSSLSHLLLAGNRLTSLPSSLVAIPSLEALDLSRNALRAIRGDILKRWEARCRLSILDLHDNALTAIPQEIQAMSRTLRRFYLHQNRLTSLPSAALAEMTRIEELTLSQNQLSGDSVALIPLPAGQASISFANNQLRVLPRVVTVQVDPSNILNTSVQSVDFRSNRLRSVVDWTPLVLARCQSLHLQQNALRELPDHFFACFPSLRVCELQSNQLQALPVSFTACTQLQALDVHDNCLRLLPQEMVELPYLETVNAVDNELTEIPLGWHAFETQCDGARVLHSLSLRRNPFSSKILKAIIDGGVDGALSTSKARMATADDLVCEGVIKKLLVGLRDASINLRDTKTRHASARKAWVDSDDDSDGGLESSTSKWRGVARDVNHYLEQRLRAMQRPGTPGKYSSLIVEVKSFERLIRTLPFTCSKRELAHVVARFLARVNEGNEHDGHSKCRRQVDGLVFLQAIENFGRWRSMATPSRRSMISTANPQTDTAGPIIRYLVMLRSMQEEQACTSQDSDAAEQRKPKKVEIQRGLKTKLRKKQQEAKKTQPADPEMNAVDMRRKMAPMAAPSAYEKSCTSRSDVIVQRQRQRIQVLEQQLLDQKLLMLSQHQPVASVSSIAPADLSVVRDDDQDPDEGDWGAYDEDSTNRTVIISVKCLHLQDTEEGGDAGKQQVEHWRIPKRSARLDFRILPDDTVLRLKQMVQTRIEVPVDHQILIANCVGRGAPAIRLRNDAVLREYADPFGGSSRWTITLLIGQSLPLYGGVS